MSGKKRARGGRRVTVDAEVETSQRERVTYGAPSGTTTTTTATADDDDGGEWERAAR